MSIDLIIKVLIPIFGAIITYILVPLIRQKTTKEQREDVYFWVKVAVNAAEMIYQEKGQGKLKKEFVVEYLEKLNIKMSIEDLDLLIEAIVFEMNQAKKELED